MRRLIGLAIFVLVLVAVFGVRPAMAREKPVIGWVERVQIHPGAFEIHAKIDTGAKTSSLNAPNLIISERGGEEWASFDVTNRNGVTRRFEEKIFRIVKIRRHGGRIQKRPVIMLGLCVGNVYQKTEVNLINRERFNYQMLVGRRFLSGHVLVDPGRVYIAKPNCKQAASINE